jgi:excisionase family DNA binding protein
LTSLYFKFEVNTIGHKIKQKYQVFYLLCNYLHLNALCGIIGNMEDKYYTPAELAKILKVTPRTIINLIEKGKLKAVNVGAKKRARWRIFEGQYLNFLAESYK